MSERYSLRRGPSITDTLVAVLTSMIVFACVSCVRSSAKEDCLAIAGVLGRGMLLYTSDHDDHFPLSGKGAPGSNWGPALLPYHTGPAQFRCPDDTTKPPDEATWGMEGTERPGRVYSFGLNSNLPAADLLVSPKDGHVNGDNPGHARLSRPEATVMLFEVSDAVGYLDAMPASGTARSIAQTESPTGNTTGNPLDKRVPGGSRSQSFADGLNRNPHILYVRYATGNVGGRVLNGGEGSVPRHAGRATYCLADGHALSIVPESVSGGADAVDPACDQGTTRNQAGICANQKRQNAAGTSAKRFTITFSTR